MKPGFEELMRFLGWMLAGGFFGFLLGHTSWGFLTAAAVYGLIHFHRLWLFLRWMDSGEFHRPPGWGGLWGEVVQRVYLIEKKNQKRKSKLSRLFQRFNETSAAMPDPAVILGSYGKIEWFNEAAQRLLGLRHPQDIGYRITNLVRHPAFTRYMAQGQYTDSVEIPSPVLDEVYLSCRLVPYGEDQLLLSAQDVTRMHRLEQMRRDFVGNVSHELRTPLTVINGYLETLLDSDDPAVDDLRLSFIQMHDQAQRMRQIVDDLLMLTRLETGEEKPFQDVSVPSLLYASAEEARVLSGEQRHQIRVHSDDDLWLTGNTHELHSVVSNLITNAVRYTPAQSSIDVHWFADEQGAHLRVVDNGPGIAAQHISRLTERFYRVDTGRSREAGGTGLGLAIVKHIVLHHGGQLNIDSELGKGSTFSIRFRTESIRRKSLLDTRLSHSS